ncbi:MAG TPA: nuclear transport factor 2 family protein [Chloroflexota bacterium]
MNAREKALLQVAQRHFDAEVEGDIEKTIETLTDDIVYEHPFYDDVMHGKDEVRQYYRRTWAASPFREVKIVRYWISGDNVIVIEVDARAGHPGEPPRRGRTLAICKFRNDRLSHEIVYSPRV